MTFLIENRPRIQSGMCLIYTGEPDHVSVFLGHVDFLTEEATLKEYKQWGRDCAKNMLCLTDPKMAPQFIPHSSIKQVESVLILQQQLFDKEYEELDEEDILVPFFGGISGSNFRSLLNRLWALKTEGNRNIFFEYKQELRQHYRELFDYHLNKKKEESNGQELSG